MKELLMLPKPDMERWMFYQKQPKSSIIIHIENEPAQLNGFGPTTEEILRMWRDMFGPGNLPF